MLDLTEPCASGPDGQWDNNALPIASGVGGMGSHARTVMYRPGKVLKAGGVNASGGHGKTIFIDFTGEDQATPEWDFIDDIQQIWEMAVPRWRHDMVLLPDGRILAVGGYDEFGRIREAEWIDPENFANGWLELAPQDYYQRGEGPHSLAILLPDARVLALGGENNAPDSDKAEVFSPPYLFDASGNPATRPIIGWAPTAVDYDTPFTILLPSTSEINAHSIAKVTLVRLGAVTHGFDQNQRFIKLDFSVIKNFELQAQSPPDGNYAPPGYYMLFLISDSGVPSEAHFIRIEPAL